MLRNHWASGVLAVGLSLAPLVAVAQEITDEIEAANAETQSFTANLPLFKSIAGEHVDELPLPVGLNFSYVHTWDELDITRLDASIGSVTIPVPSNDLSRVKVSTSSFTGTIDVWILPFLDLYMLGGHSQGDAEITVSIPNLLPQLDVEVPYDVWTWGGGGVLTGGWEQFVGLVNMTYTISHVDVLESKVGTLLIAPRAGIRHSFGGIDGVLMAGANYMRISQHLFGQYEFGPLAIDYDLDIQEADAWNGAVGVNIDFWKHVSLVVEGGIGTRRSVLAAIVGRF